MINYENFSELEFEAVALEVRRYNSNGTPFYGTRLALVIDVENNVALFLPIEAYGTTALEAARAAMMHVLRMFERIATHAPVIDAATSEFIEMLDLEEYIQKWMHETETISEHGAPPGVTIH